ncbi:MAG: hypothetical protein HQL80_12930 [Magnetococcales bacterium]|nr:hypothetical protein [Magnetococcales bacterium]
MLAGCEAFESQVAAVWSRSQSRWPDERRLSRWWLALFPGALVGREMFEWYTGLEREIWRADGRRG